MDKRELQSWLCGPDARVPSPAEIARLLGVRLETIADTTLLRTSTRLRALWFTIAVLRDVFTDDVDVHRWLRRRRAELGERSALDLLIAGRTEEVEALAMREWHAPLGAPSVARDRGPGHVRHARREPAASGA